MMVIRTGPFNPFILDLYPDAQTQNVLYDGNNTKTIRAAYSYALMFQNRNIRTYDGNLVLAVLTTYPYAVINLHTDLDRCMSFYVTSDYTLVSSYGVCGYIMPMFRYARGRLLHQSAGLLAPGNFVTLVHDDGLSLTADVQFISSTIYARSCIWNYDVSGGRRCTIYISPYYPDAIYPGLSMIKITPKYGKSMSRSAEQILMYTPGGKYEIECLDLLPQVR